MKIPSCLRYEDNLEHSLIIPQEFVNTSTPLKNLTNSDYVMFIFSNIDKLYIYITVGQIIFL